MLYCTNCNDLLCYENEILDIIEDEKYDEMIDGYCCFDIKCEKYSHTNIISAKLETSLKYDIE